MKIRIIIMVFFICSFTIDQNLQAQFIMHEDGQITLQHNTANWYHGIQIFPTGVVHFNTTQTHPWHFVTVASPKHVKGKCWMVTYPDMDDAPGEQKNDHRFFVTGDGNVYQRGNLVLADMSLQAENEPIYNPEEILDGITGTYYVYTDEIYGNTRGGNRRVGVIANEVEKVLPEAVVRDDRDLMYVDYEALTVVLIEAYKQQKAEIELLRKTLEEHGLLKSEK